MNSCLHCKHARWVLTKNGRVNPNKVGDCTWTKTVHVPKAYWTDPICEGAVVLRGTYISRKTPYEKCPTFQERL